MDDILDLTRFPLNDLDTSIGQTLIAHCRDELDRFGMFNLDGLVRPKAVRDAVAELTPVVDTQAFTHARKHNIYFQKDIPDLPADHPARAEFETINHTICADQMASSLITRIYEYAPLINFLAEVMRKPQLHAMADPLARINVMRYGAGEALNWHFDRSEFTTTLLLQAPEFGGIFQYARDLRSEDDPGYANVARLLEGSWPVENIRLMPGTLNVFRGRNTAHRVTTVGGQRPRMIAVFSYFDRPGVEFSEAERLGFYGRAS